MQKGQIDKSRLMQKSNGVSDYKPKSCFVFKIMNIIISLYKCFLVLAIFSSTIGISQPLRYWYQ
jgi:hypothetical protein